MNAADTSWILTSTALVLLMTLPGLALFYAGLVQARNILSVLMQCMGIACAASLLWFAFGYSLAFDAGNAWLGGTARFFLAGIDRETLSGTLPESLFAMFQMTFAIITPALMVGAFVERIRFGAVMLISSLWLLIVYAPVTHWVWGGGWLAQQGIIDFAGGIVVHVTAGISAAVIAIILGARKGFPDRIIPPHAPWMVMVGASLLWVGWFGFNAGSNLEANGLAAQVIVNTVLATAAAALAWSCAEWVHRGTPTVLGAASGAVAGLVAVTPACGWVGPMGAICIGFVAGLICLFGVTRLKAMFGYDDSLDVFGVHGIGGIVGALLTAVFCDPALGGTGVYDYVANATADYSITAQLTAQLWAVGTTILWSGVVSVAGFALIDSTIGLRVSEDQERAGLDTCSHGESAYT